RRIDNDADVFALAEGQQVLLDPATDERILWLQRSDRRDALRRLQLGDRERGRAGPAQFALLVQGDQRLPALFRVGKIVGRLMHLVEIDDLDAQPAEAV